MSAIQSIAKSEDLRKRIGFTLIALFICRLGVHIPAPGINGAAVLEFFKAQSTGIFGVFNVFSGGALERFSVLALGIMPYISASIIVQLLTTVVPYLESLKKEGDNGRKKINQITRYAALGLAIVQGFAMSKFLASSQGPSGESLVISPYVGILPFEIMTVITLVTGTMFIMWLGEQITERGIGNGSSMIIFSGIVAGVPQGIVQIIDLINNGQMTVVFALLLGLGIIAVLAGIIFMEVAQRRIPIQYSQRGQGPQAMSAPASHLPLKINFSGVIPPIFASSLLLFPATMVQTLGFEAPWLIALRETLSPNGALYNIFFVALIVFFCFFYTQIVFNPVEVSDNLKKFGGFVPGIRAGKSTSDYIMYVLERINVLGAIYISAVCVIPQLASSHLKLPFYLGGTSILILVGVALDTSQQVQSYLINQKYDAFLKGKKIRSRRVQY